MAIKREFFSMKKNEIKLSSFHFTTKRHVHMQIPHVPKGRYIK